MAKGRSKSNNKPKSFKSIDRMIEHLMLNQMTPAEQEQARYDVQQQRERDEDVRHVRKGWTFSMTVDAVVNTVERTSALQGQVDDDFIAAVKRTGKSIVTAMDKDENPPAAPPAVKSTP